MRSLVSLVLVVAFSWVGFAQSNEESLSLEQALSIEASADLESLAVGYRCCAGDVGFEEHGDHCVQSVTQIGGEARALEVCQTFHARCQSYGCTKN